MMTDNTHMVMICETCDNSGAVSRVLTCRSESADHSVIQHGHSLSRMWSLQGLHGSAWSIYQSTSVQACRQATT